jgi:hypothetical protein
MGDSWPFDGMRHASQGNTNLALSTRLVKSAEVVLVSERDVK